MSLLALLFLLQNDDSAPTEKPLPPVQFEFGPIAEYWFPRFKGSMRVDGSTTTGSTLKFVNDLGLPDDASIPVLGGGNIGVAFNDSGDRRTHLSFVAEYWRHHWSGHETLKQPASLGDHSFPAGTTIESRFSLASLTLDAGIWGESKDFAAGLQVSIQIRTADLHMESPTVHAKETITDIYWGIGGFGEFRPISFASIGGSVRFYSGFGDAAETAAGDFRIYGALRWGPFRLEGGFRTIVYDRDAETKSLNYTLYGSYALFSAILRF